MISVAIAYNYRNNSRFFAETTANIFAANGIRVYLFESLRPTPELSYAIRQRNWDARAGWYCTASHNPKEYNGYKAYWDDEAQMVPPHNKNVSQGSGEDRFAGRCEMARRRSQYHPHRKRNGCRYLNMVKGLSIYPRSVRHRRT